MGPEEFAIWMAEAAVQFATTELVKASLGIMSTDQIIDKALAALREYIHKEITENELGILRDNISSALEYLNEFQLFVSRSDKIKNLFLVESAILKTTDAIERSKSLGLPAIYCFFNSVSLHLVSRVLHNKVLNDDGDHDVIREIVKKYTDDAFDIACTWKQALFPGKRLSGLNPACRWSLYEGLGGQVAYIGECRAILDGKEFVLYQGEEINADAYNVILQEKYDELEEYRIKILKKIDDVKNKVEGNWLLLTADKDGHIFIEASAKICPDEPFKLWEYSYERD